MKKEIVVVSMLIMTGCHATIGTPSGIREHYRGVNGGLTVSKAKNDAHIEKGYWESEMAQIKAWAKSWLPTEEVEK